MAKKQIKRPDQYLEPWPVERVYFYTAFKERLTTISSLTAEAILIGVNRRDIRSLTQQIPAIRLLSERLRREALEMQSYRHRRTPGWVNGITDSLLKLTPEMVKQSHEAESFISAQSWESIKSRLDFCHNAAELILLNLLQGPKPKAEQPVNDSLIAEGRRIAAGDIAMWNDTSDLAAAFAEAKNKTRRKPKGTKLRPARTPATRRANGGAKGEYRYC